MPQNRIGAHTAREVTAVPADIWEQWRGTHPCHCVLCCRECAAFVFGYRASVLYRRMGFDACTLAAAESADTLPG
jgi:hypothetical protein